MDSLYPEEVEPLHPLAAQGLQPCSIKLSHQENGNVPMQPLSLSREEEQAARRPWNLPPSSCCWLLCLCSRHVGDGGARLSRPRYAAGDKLLSQRGHSASFLSF